MEELQDRLLKNRDELEWRIVLSFTQIEKT